ncbi:MAG: helix-turn-helix transcriptional regulator [Ruminococcaceae bacterium]|nr:helix-turn-helix transcriptional regulator [Oscillospiraceae bacterium]
MNDIKSIIAKNIADLRLAKGMTQLELAEQLHYSDKAVSKWERGESVPEIATLKAIADLFGVTLDHLVNEHSPEEKKEVAPERKYRFRNRSLVTGMCAVLVWFVALLAFVTVDLLPIEVELHWLAFVYAVPATLLLWLVFNSVWFNPRTNFIIISALVWSALGSLHVTAWVFGNNIWKIYLLGIPAQLVILLWSRIKPVIKNKIQK